MKFIAVLLLASAGFCADLPTGASLLDQSLAHTGGAAVARVKNAVMTGTVELTGHNLSGPLSVYESGDKSYTVIDLPGIGKMEEGFDGDVAWEMSAIQGSRIKEGDEREAVRRASKITLLGTWRDYYKSARTLGAEDVGGKPAWKVELTPTQGKPEMFFFDQASLLLVRIAMTLPTAMGDIPVDMTMSDYRVVDGVKTPFSMTQNAMGQTMVMRFSKIVYNGAIPPGRFDLPQTIRALAEKKP